MEISNSAAGIRVTLESIKSSLLESLRAGQIVQAKTLSASVEGRVTLRIGNTQLAAQTPVPLKAGEQLQLQVAKVENPLQLRLLGEPPNRVQAAAMRTALPKQRPLSELMQRLLPLVESISGKPHTPVGKKAGTARTLPAAYQFENPALRPQQLLKNRLLGKSPLPFQAVRQVPLQPALPIPSRLPQPLSVIPLADKPLPAVEPAITARNALEGMSSSPLPADAKMTRSIEKLLPMRLNVEAPITGEAVRRAFATSGIFFETLLSQNSVPPNDVKRSLFELLLQLRLHLPASQQTAQGNERAVERFALLVELIAQTEGSLARVVLNQLASLPQEEANQQQWQLDIPVRQANGEETVRLRIEREPASSSQSKGSDRWTVGIDFNIDPIGPLHARLTLYGEEISSRFTAEKYATVEKLRSALHLLESAFSRAGFKVGSLSATQGTVDNEIRSPFPLLDEHA